MQMDRDGNNILLSVKKCKDFEVWWNENKPAPGDRVTKSIVERGWNEQQIEIDEKDKKIADLESILDATIEQRDKNYDYYEIEIKRLKEIIKELEKYESLHLARRPGDKL